MLPAFGGSAAIENPVCFIDDSQAVGYDGHASGEMLGHVNNSVEFRSICRLHLPRERLGMVMGIIFPRPYAKGRSSHREISREDRGTVRINGGLL
eukprot:6604202-Heterocapsa_arctica.AAC.1